MLGLAFLLIGCRQSTISPIQPAPTLEKRESGLATLILFDDTLSLAWTVAASENAVVQRAEGGRDAIDGGSLVVLPSANENSLIFTPNEQVRRVYPISPLQEISFWINAGADSMPISSLTFGLMGSEGARLELPASSLTSATAFPVNTWVELNLNIGALTEQIPDRNIAGIYLRQAGRHRYFVDDIVFQMLPNSSAPVVTEITIADAGTVTVTFSEAINPYSAADQSNYRVNADMPAKAAYNAGTNQVVLTLAQPFQPGRTYTLEIGAVRDVDFPPAGIAGEKRFELNPHNVVLPGMEVIVDVNAGKHPISPLIYGVAGADPNYKQTLNVALDRWGGNPNSRYNWQLGNAWNTGSDYFFQNTNYGFEDESVSDTFLATNNALGVTSLLTVPTLGWVAKDTESCAFPLPDGSCGDGEFNGCDPSGTATPLVNPEETSVPASPEFALAWLAHIRGDLHLPLPIIAMDNEPGLWGVTHQDVHPNCTTYDEIYGRFAQYAAPIKTAYPNSEIAGPISCCWNTYWNSLAGQDDKLAHNGQDFLPWFLQQANAHEKATGQRLLDVLDIHYYPENVFEEELSDEVAARRLRSTRSLWDREYVDESWIAEPVYLIPRMRQLIAGNYPDTKLAISEWNWGADDSVNGALALADVLGIYGREGLYYAAYWRHPAVGSPGYHAFKMFTNFDNAGSRFGDISVQAQTTDSDVIATFAALDSETGNLHVMLINKQPEQPETISLSLLGFDPTATVSIYRYGRFDPTQIYQSTEEMGQAPFLVSLPPYSISLLVFTA